MSKELNNFRNIITKKRAFDRREFNYFFLKLVTRYLYMKQKQIQSGPAYNLAINLAHCALRSMNYCSTN